MQKFHDLWNKKKYKQCRSYIRQMTRTREECYFILRHLGDARLYTLPALRYMIQRCKPKAYPKLRELVDHILRADEYFQVPLQQHQRLEYVRELVFHNPYVNDIKKLRISVEFNQPFFFEIPLNWTMLHNRYDILEIALQQAPSAMNKRIVGRLIEYMDIGEPEMKMALDSGNYGAVVELLKHIPLNFSSQIYEYFDVEDIIQEDPFLRDAYKMPMHARARLYPNYESDVMRLYETHETTTAQEKLCKVCKSIVKYTDKGDAISLKRLLDVNCTMLDPSTVEYVYLQLERRM